MSHRSEMTKMRILEAARFVTLGIVKVKPRLRKDVEAEGKAEALEKKLAREAEVKARKAQALEMLRQRLLGEDRYGDGDI